MNPNVVDISHHNNVDPRAIISAGVIGVIHKATQGSTYRDPDYARRRKVVEDAGVLWGAYHFNDGSDVDAQLSNFLATAQPSEKTLCVLDFEDNQRSNMSIQQLVAFLRGLEQRTGRLGTIYSGNRLKENMHNLSAEDRAYVCKHKLWLCQYGAHATVPLGFTEYFLWQYTDGNVGPEPRRLPGIEAVNIDLNQFTGTRDELAAQWTVAADVPPFSAHAADAIADSMGPSAHTSDAVRDDAQPAPTNASTRYSVNVEIVQRRLDAMGYHEVGLIDGKWGGRCAAGIAAFFNDRHVDSSPVLGETLNDAIADAMDDNWTRPIADVRANAQPADIAPKVAVVRLNLWQRLGAQIAAGAGAIGLTGSSLSTTFANVKDKMQPLHDVLGNTPAEVWFGLLILTAGVVWYVTDRAAQAATTDYNTGRLN